ncbi:MAG: hypothetical protein QW156_02785 [Candidatus Aenigmatarchaeota archaeon]
MLSRKARIGIIIVSTFLLVFIILMGAKVIPFYTLTYPTLSIEEIKQKVKNLYELANPGVTVEIASVTEESGLYKIILKAIDMGGINYREVFVTKDGKLLTEGVVLVEESIKQITRLKDFVDCLNEKGVKIYGLNNNTATLLQLNLLGRYSLKLYVSCDGDLVQNCIQANVSQVPSVVHNNKVEPGVKSIDWFEKISGCKY